MKKPVIITADSTVDLSRELKERYDIRIIPLMITLGEDHFVDDGFGGRLAEGGGGRVRRNRGIG